MDSKLNDVDKKLAAVNAQLVDTNRSFDELNRRLDRASAQFADIGTRPNKHNDSVTDDAPKVNNRSIKSICLGE